MAQWELVERRPVAEDGPMPSVVDWLATGWMTPPFGVRVVKRSMDILLSVVALLVVLPFALPIMVAIVIEGRGSPIFLQRRVGRYGAPFSLIKFRTMVCDAESRLQDCLDASPELREEWRRSRKLRDDPRITTVGRYLRRWSLDEVPQLVNVLLGQMSLVGPRPVPPLEGVLFGASWPVILSMRPGLTGLWAVSGRNDVSYDARVALEASYVRGYRLRGDLAIILRTIPWVLEGRGSY